MPEEYQNFQSLINLNLCDEKSVITGCELVTNFESQFLNVYYTISKEYATENDLYYKNRILSILLKAGKDFKGLPISSYANTNIQEVAKC